MAIEKRIYSDLPIAPGEYLAEVLTEKGMSQAELGRRMGRPPQAINEIVAGKKAITPDTALQLERTLGVPASLWTGLETRFQLVKARLEEKIRLENDLPHLKEIPYAELSKLGFVKNVRSGVGKVRELQAFYGVSTLSNLSNVHAYKPAFRSSPKKSASSYALAAWLKAAESKAQEIITEAFSKTTLAGNLQNLRALTLTPAADIESNIRKLLSDSGIAFVLLPHFRKTYAHGAAFWLDPKKAVLVMSLRGSWADIFWFSLFHETGHFLLHDVRKTFIERRGKTTNPVEEREADDFAADQLIPRSEYEALLRYGEFHEGTIMEFAQKVGIAPGIVVGRLEHDGYLRQDSALNKIRLRYQWA